MASTSPVVLDSNILISALIHAGIARAFIYKLILKNIHIVISDYIIFEVEDVLKRHKFKHQRVLRDLWQLISQDVTLVKVKTKTHPTPLRDPKDHPILQTAQKAKAKFIITGNKDLLSLGAWKDITITSLANFDQLITS